MSNAPIILDQATSSGPPSATLRNPGASVVVGIVNVGEYQQKDFDSGEMEYWDEARTQPKMGKVVTGIVVSATDTALGTDSEDGTPAPDAQPGSIVAFFCEGGKHFTWRDAVKAHGAVSPGDVMLWKRIEDDPPKKKGFNPKKNYTATIRKPKTDGTDGDLFDRCVQAYYDAKQAPALDAPAASTQSYDASSDVF